MWTLFRTDQVRLWHTDIAQMFIAEADLCATMGPQSANMMETEQS